MQEKFQFPNVFTGVVIQREDKSFQVPGRDEKIELPLVKVRTEENEVVTVVPSKDVKEGMSYQFMVNGNWELKDDLLRHNRDGTIIGCHANDGNILRPQIMRVHPIPRGPDNLSKLLGEWSLIGGEITAYEAAVGITMEDGGNAICDGNYIDIQTPTPMITIASLLYAQMAWDKKVIAKGPDEFLMEVWDKASDLSVSVENFSPKNAVRGLYSSKLLAAPQPALFN